MDIEPDVAKGEVEVFLARAIEVRHADDAGDDDEAAHTEKEGEEVFLAGREFEAGDFAEGEHEDDDFKEGFDDGHGEPEGEVGYVPVEFQAFGKEVGDWVAGVKDFDDGGGDTPADADGSEDEGGVAEMSRVEEVAVEQEDGDLNETGNGPVEAAVDVYIL